MGTTRKLIFYVKMFVTYHAFTWELQNDHLCNLLKLCILYAVTKDQVCYNEVTAIFT